MDFGLLNRHGRLIGNPYHYRDGRTDGMLAEAFRRAPRAEIFEQTGIQFLQINSLYQLLSMTLSGAPELAEAETFLPMPSLFSYWLSGRAVCEFSIATTTQCYNPRLDGWATPLIAALEIPTGIFPEVVPAGTVLGPLQTRPGGGAGRRSRPDHRARLPRHRLRRGRSARRRARNDFAWISSGTWSVMGAELAEPFITPQSLAYDFTNEGGAGHTFRFCKNIMGLWLLQECRRVWANQGEARSYAEWTEMAAGASPFCSVIDVDDGDFLKPGDMPERIRAFCRRTGQAVAGRERGVGPLHPGGDRPQIPAAAGAAGGDAGPAAGADPHRRRRRAEPAAVALHRGRDRASRWSPARWRRPPRATSWCRRSPRATWAR